MSDNSLYDEFSKNVPILEESNKFDFRIRQYAFCDLLKTLIEETIKKPFNEDTVTAFIQISKNRSKDDNIVKYLKLLALPEEVEKKLIREMLSSSREDRGLTGAGKSSVSPVRMAKEKGQKLEKLSEAIIDKLHEKGMNYFEDFRQLLIGASNATGIEDAEAAVQEFLNKNVPMIKDGIFSSLLCYINPKLFPISNNSTKDYYRELGWKGNDYLSLMKFTRALLEPFKDKNYLLLDAVTRPSVKYLIHPSLKPEKSVYIEKTYPKDVFSKYLLSPSSGGDGRDTYSLMRRVMPGDIILHFVDNDKFIGISVAEKAYEEVETSLAEDEEDSTHYQVKLRNYIELEEAINRNEIFSDEFSSSLLSILEENKKNKLFYNKKFEMNQGAYLTEGLPGLIKILNTVYKRKLNKLIPGLESYGEFETENYWLFQGNPSVYDVARALNDNMVKEWWVKSHKDKIKIGDKGIIWTTGKDSGCFAFFKVTSELYHKGEDQDQEQYYNTEINDDFDTKVNIEVEINLANNPIYKDQVKDFDWYKNFKGGSQGTTFSMTKEEYKGFRSMVSKKEDISYWTVGCGVNGILWDDFKEKEEISIGWEPLGDHSRFSSREEVEKEYFEQYNPQTKATNDTLCIWEFSNVMKKGDIVFVKTGKRKFLAAAIVVSEFVEYHPQREKHQMVRKVRWLNIKDHTYEQGGPATKTLTNIDRYTDFIKELRQIYGLDNIKEQAMSNKTQDQLNRILYGPPGTGKTYEVRKMALDIIMGDNAPTDYDEVVEEFKKLQKDGQVEFVTFHPNFGYENFVEGIFPDVDNTAEMRYLKKPGVFKRICEEALKNLSSSQGDTEYQVEEDFEKRWRLFVEEVENHEGPYPFKTLNGTAFTLRTTDTDGSYVSYESGNGHHIAKKRYLRVFKHLIATNNKEPVRADINTSSLQTYIAPVMRKLFTYNVGRASSTEVSKNYVLVIDEINRGNIPAIFGELITLIEPTKRIGASEALKLTLPLSNDEEEEQFGVPKNLYILGTMNTADKSVEALDAALRRRFSFLPKYPNPIHEKMGSIEGIDLSEMLRKMNKRIKVLKGEDYQIGHSYFLNIKSQSALVSVFENKVIPLLQEYFYEDLGKIQMILGTSFVESQSVDSDLFLGDSADVDDFDLFELQSSNNWDFKSIYE